MITENPAGNRKSAALLAILVCGLAARLVLLFCLQGEPLHIIDEQQYNDIAVSMAKTGNFATSSGELTSIRPPLFVWMAAGVYRLLGVENPTLVFTVIRGINVALSLLSTVIVYWLGKRLFGNEETALTAAGLFCFYPSLVWLNFTLLTETLFIFWLVLSVYLAICMLDKRSDKEKGRLKRLIGLSILCGVCLGLGALTRSILWLAIPCLSAFLFLFLPCGTGSGTGRISKLGGWLERSGWFERSVCAGLVFLSGFLTILPWAVRNTRLQKTVTIVDCMSGRNLMMGNYEYTPMYRAWDAISMEPPRDWISVLRGYTHPFNALTQGQKDKIAGKYAKEYIVSHPGLTAARCGMKLFCFWQLERSLPGAVRQGWYGAGPLAAGLITIVVWGVFVLTFLFSLAGAALWILDGSARRNWRAGLLLLCVVGLFWGVHTLVFAHSRYHLPLIFVLSLFAGYFLVQVISSRRSRKVKGDGLSETGSSVELETGSSVDRAARLPGDGSSGRLAHATLGTLLHVLIWTAAGSGAFILFWFVEIFWMFGS